MILQNHNTNLGIIEISSEVIEVIASIAVEETKGVHSLQNNFASGNIEKIGKKFRGRGVKVETKDGQIHIAIYVVLSTDRNVHSVAEDRKSTRLNSSHVSISYAVFCLKKKTINTIDTT